jgi:transposase
VTAANVNEVTQLLQVLTDMPAVSGKPGPKRRLAERLQGDRGYDSEPLRVLLRWLGITPVLAKRNTEHGSGLGKLRWFVERTVAWLHAFGRLRRRLDRLTELQEAFLRLACALICLRILGSLSSFFPNALNKGHRIRLDRRFQSHLIIKQ